MSRLQGIHCRQFSANSRVSKDPPNIFGDQTPKEFIERKYSGGLQFGIEGLQSNGVYLYMGWSFEFKQLLKRYLYKQHNQWHECYAPNKALLRKSVYGRINEIIEIPKLKEDC